MTTLFIFLSGLGAGFFGVLVGLGGGVIIVPLLTLVFGLPIKTAVATSLCSICATSIGGTARYLNKGLVDYRTGLFLETTSIIGAIGGGILALIIKPEIVSATFAVILIYTSINMLIKIGRKEPEAVPGFTPVVSTVRKYVALGLSVIGGMASSMLGVGGGVVKVPILNIVLRLPIKTAVATSTFMLGITASSGALVYYIAQMRGTVDYVLIDFQTAAPLILGTLAGSSIGAMAAGKMNAKVIKTVLIIALFYAGLRIGLQAIGIKLL